MHYCSTIGMLTNSECLYREVCLLNREWDACVINLINCKNVQKSTRGYSVIVKMCNFITCYITYSNILIYKLNAEYIVCENHTIHSAFAMGELMCRQVFCLYRNP